MATAFQDDERENDAIKLFALSKDEDSGRSGTDAYLVLDGIYVPFELKSTSTGSVTTVRDFGPDHVVKWKGKHWLIGFYDGKKTVSYYLYGSPLHMSKWIQEKSDYVRPDFELSRMVPSLITINHMITILGSKEIYSLDDATKIQKKQYTAAKYRKMMDLPEGYSASRMLEILIDRIGYIMRRGSTLNNPHIPESYFDGWEKLQMNHAERLREMVRAYWQEVK